MSARRYWTTVELELLRRHYADSHTTDIAQALGRDPRQVLAKANAMGLHKTRAFIAEVARERTLRPEHGGRATQFRKGQAPANKGVKQPPGWAPGNMAATRFKPGNRPQTWVPVGSYTVNGDGYLDQKVNDDPGPRHVRWKPVHRLVWEAAHGPVPAGHAVVFKPGMKSTQLEKITLDTVELVTRAELMRRNSVQRYGRELANLMQLRGQLVRQINLKHKEQKA